MLDAQVIERNRIFRINDGLFVAGDLCQQIKALIFRARAGADEPVNLVQLRLRKFQLFLGIFQLFHAQQNIKVGSSNIQCQCVFGIRSIQLGCFQQHLALLDVVVDLISCEYRHAGAYANTVEADTHSREGVGQRVDRKTKVVTIVGIGIQVGQAVELVLLQRQFVGLDRRLCLFHLQIVLLRVSNALLQRPGFLCQSATQKKS